MAQFAPSLLDRLAEDPEIHGFQDLQKWKKRLLEEIELLLNAKRARIEVPEAFVYTSRSLPMYGLPDAGSLDVHNKEDQEMLRKSIENALRNFEPRLISISVTLDHVSEHNPVLDFTVHALARLDPYTEPIEFETRLRTNKVEVRKSGL